jgi:predicted transcriptional regulator
MTVENKLLLNLTAEIVSAFAGRNAVSAEAFPDLIRTVHRTLAGLGDAALAEAQELTPAVPIKKSVTNDEIICLECGRGAKMLKRHLASAHGLSPDEYRQRWRLPADYPVVAPVYAAKRSSLAKQIGLGRKPGKMAKKKKK